MSYTGEDAAQKFVEMLEEDIKIIANIPEKKMIFEKEENERFEKETKCWMCNEEFNDEDVKVRDHCHFTGRYRGAAHNSCNLKYRKPNFTPVAFHNLSGYDSHLFIKNLGFSGGNIDCIPNNEERYISFTKRIQAGRYTNKKGEIKPLHHQIRVIDSFKFMATSLDSVVNNLPKDAFNNVKRYYAEDKLSLLTKKGIYPYEYMNSQEKVKETKLPPREAFYSRLIDENISDSFIKREPSKYITYLDANILYGWAMSKPLPTHSFKWMKVSELETWENHSCILEVDLEYPRSLHDLHSDYP